MYNFYIILAVAKHTFVKVLRKPVVLTFSFFQPLMWMFFFGFLFYRFPLNHLREDISYIDFLLPGICCMTALFGASQSGVTIIRDIQTGFLYRMLRTPANRGAILFGKISADVLRLIFQVIVVIGIGALMGVTFRINAIGVFTEFYGLDSFCFCVRFHFMSYCYSS